MGGTGVGEGAGAAVGVGAGGGVGLLGARGVGVGRAAGRVGVALPPEAERTVGEAWLTTGLDVGVEPPSR
ncbi:hypothetical protein OO015_09720 [Thermomicrobium sp. 4228-Ro]|uniref:hypothetical protein n=1 Tax=Thermomicrobium sp. 4228-Ro TaxID=2993937 RepID=UPI00224883AA|nr:hypothetical protein [Thermomicrobium sp. 4228-Ro]MCX2727763.1 hypothetical protein [Thermomicrobium sp. 4228-Ro]